MAVRKMGSPSQFASLTVIELRLTLRAKAWRILTWMCALVTAAIYGLMALKTPYALSMQALAGFSVRMALEGVLLLVSPLLVCACALREKQAGMEEIVLSKPPSSPTLVWSRFAAFYLAAMLTALLCGAAVWLVQIVFFRPDLSAAPALRGALSMAMPLLFVCGFSLSAALYTRSPLAGGLITGIVLGIRGGGDSLAHAARLTLTPYHPAYGVLGLAFVALAAGVWKANRDRGRIAGPWVIVASIAVCVSLLMMRSTTSQWYSLSSEYRSASDAITASKSLLKDVRSLVTVSGRRTTKDPRTGVATLFAFYSSASPQGATEVATLQRACRDAVGTLILFVPVYVGEDPGIGEGLARDAEIQGDVISNPPPDSDEIAGLAKRFAVDRHLVGASAGILWPDGAIAFAAQILALPETVTGRPPRTGWNKALYSQGLIAFKEVAKRGQALADAGRIAP